MFQQAGTLEIYKGYSLSKKAEDFLASHGIKEAAYSISASDVSQALFGSIVPCPYQVRLLLNLSLCILWDD